MSKQYYPNNWELFKNAPDEVFKTCTFEEFEDWKIGGWELPSSVDCLMRCENLKTGKVKEWTYNRPAMARKKLLKLMEDENNVVTVCTADEIVSVYAEDLLNGDS